MPIFTTITIYNILIFLNGLMYSINFILNFMASTKRPNETMEDYNIRIIVFLKQIWFVFVQLVFTGQVWLTLMYNVNCKVWGGQ